MTKNRFLVSALLSVSAAMAAISVPIGMAGGRFATPEAVPSAPAALRCSEASRGETCIPSDPPHMLTEYLVCSALAETRILGRAEALVCLESFLAVKLSFIAGFEPKTYRALPFDEQIEMNRRAYVAYREWSRSDPQFARIRCEISAACGDLM